MNPNTYNLDKLSPKAKSALLDHLFARARFEATRTAVCHSYRNMLIGLMVPTAGLYGFVLKITLVSLFESSQLGITSIQLACLVIATPILYRPIKRLRHKTFVLSASMPLRGKDLRSLDDVGLDDQEGWLKDSIVQNWQETTDSVEELNSARFKICRQALFDLELGLGITILAWILTALG